MSSRIEGASAPGASARQKNLAIQQLRGVAIGLVLLQHLSLPNQLLGLLGGRVTNPGYSGVELFFVISGYVVTMSLLHGGWNLRNYAVRRVFRLYPAMLAFLALSACVLLLARSYPDGHFTRIIFGDSFELFVRQGIGVLTGTFINLPGGALYSNGAMWSLSVEFQFYLALALVVAGLLLSGRRADLPRLLRIGSVVVLAACLVARLSLLRGVHLPVFGYLVSFKFDFILAGVLLALAPAWRMPARPRLVVAAALGLALVVLALSRDPLRPAAGRDILESLALPLVLACFVVVVGLAARMEGSLVGRHAWLGSALLWLGDRSYSVYLLHFPVLALVWFGLFAIDPVLPALPWRYAAVQMAVALPLACLAAALCYRFVELPGIAFGARFLVRRDAAALAPAASRG